MTSTFNEIYKDLSQWGKNLQWCRKIYIKILTWSCMSNFNRHQYKLEDNPILEKVLSQKIRPPPPPPRDIYITWKKIRDIRISYLLVHLFDLTTLMRSLLHCSRTCFAPSSSLSSFAYQFLFSFREFSGKPKLPILRIKICLKWYHLYVSFVHRKSC